MSGLAADCGLCAADETQRGFVARLASGRVVLQDDAAFRGYCILVYSRHVTELHHLSAAEQAQLVADATRIAAAIEHACQPDKFNHALLGNMVPHLHWHVIPRHRNDGWWGRSIWSRPDAQRRALAPDDFERVRAALEQALAR